MSKLSLEELVNENRQAFGEYEPPWGHVERFSNRLENKQGKKKAKSWKLQFLRIASAAVFLVLVGIGFGRKATSNSNTQTAVNVGNLSEYEAQFNAQIDQKKTTIAVSANAQNAPYISETLALVKELEGDYNQLKKELEAYGANPQVKEAVRENYRARADLLDLLMMHLDYGDNLNNTYNASTKANYDHRFVNDSCCGFGWSDELPVRENQVLYGAFYRTK